jgi:nitrogenase molybdenum-iron protein alpha/beta subunit
VARIPQLLTREKRLGAVNAYLGEVLPLIAELESGASQRIRTFSQTAPDDIGQALRFLGSINGAGIVVHGARGCANALTLAAPKGCWAVTNLDQRDTILGSDSILSQTARALYRRHLPWAIFIVATPVVAINNDDIRTAAEELSAELEIPVIEVRTDGFRSRISATGFDAAAKAVLPLVPLTESERRGDLVNLLAIESGRGLQHIISLLNGLGLEVNLLPQGADEDSFRRAATAALSVTVNPGEADALGLGLEEEFGVAFLRLPPPIGSAATHRFITAIAQATGRAADPEPVAPTVVDDLRGKRVALTLPPATAFGTADLIEQLGGEIVGISVDYIDASHVDALRDFAAGRPSLPLHVANLQPFEHANRLARIKPDLFIGSAELAASAARTGIPAVTIRPDDLLGTLGEARLARLATKALRNTALVQRLAASHTPAYQPAWFKRSPDWHIKFEVK